MFNKQSCYLTICHISQGIPSFPLPVTSFEMSGLCFFLSHSLSWCCAWMKSEFKIQSRAINKRSKNPPSLFRVPLGKNQVNSLHPFIHQSMHLSSVGQSIDLFSTSSSVGLFPFYGRPMDMRGSNQRIMVLISINPKLDDRWDYDYGAAGVEFLLITTLHYLILRYPPGRVQ